MLSRQEGSKKHHLTNAQSDQPADGFTGQLFLLFGGLVCADQISNCPLDRVLTCKNLICLLNLQFNNISSQRDIIMCMCAHRLDFIQKDSISELK